MFTGVRQWFGVLVVALGLVLSGCTYQVEVTAPPGSAESTKVFAADGSLITTLHAEQDREEVALADIAPTLRDAVIAIEDARFFTHQGVDLRALIRALRRNTEAGGVKEGGSTITQQYVKNVLLDPDRTVNRKLKEAMLAFQLERRHSKETILEKYLNRIYFGNGAYGVQAAATVYFNKPTSQLGLAESALLAGLIASPERFDPFDEPEAGLTRRNVVLDRMAGLGLARDPDLTAARQSPLGLVARPETERYPAGHFVEAVKQFVLDDPQFGPTPDDRRRLLFEEGLRIHTTVDLGLQQQAEAAVAGVLPDPGTSPANTPTGAVVVLDPRTGFIRALVGGRDFFGTSPDAKFDLATQGRRQAGSSFKPIVLAAAFEAGVRPDRVFDAPASLTVPMPEGQAPWVVENYEGGGGGQSTLLDASVASINTVYAQLITEIGPQKAMDVAKHIGITAPLRPFPSAVLGTNEVSVLDMASAYSTFAADGQHSDPVMVTEITKADGSVIYRRPGTRQRKLPAEAARQVNMVLGEVINRGTGTKANIGRPAAGKTGTAQQWRDAWFVGYTPDLVGAVWVGFADRQRSMVPPATPLRVTGGSWPAEIWNRTMSAALANVAPTPFPAPAADAPAPPPAAPATLAVPDVSGRPEADAKAALAAAGFTVTTETRPSRAVAAGSVVEQIPAPGTLVPPGGAVILTLSSGAPKTVPVPSLLDLTADEAAKRLSDAGLIADVVIAAPPPSVGARPGRVWKQAVATGVGVDEGTAVQYWASR